MVSKVAQLVFAMAVLCIASFMPYSSAQPESDHFYVKGIATDHGPYAGQYMRILGDAEKATIIRTGPNGFGIVKMNLATSALCYDKVPTTCLNGIVTQVKNTNGPHVGDIVRLVIDTSGKKQTISFLTGTRTGSIVSISLKDPNTYDGSPETANIQKSIFIHEKKNNPTLVSLYEDDGMSKAIQNAKQFATTHPTFVFDGMPESLDVNLVSIIQTEMPWYIVQVSFDSAHPGYGDRSGQVLSDVTTHHTLRVMMSDYGLGSAIMDGVWDEFNQNWQK